MGLGILAALRAAHQAGVLHRDVKPANVLLAPGGRVVLTDFGIARADDSPALTGTGVLVGSPSYISPERARGEPADAPGDMWALGACLYAAVEGRPPFERNGALASLTAVVTDEADPPSRAGPLWPVISGLLRKEPAARLCADEVEEMLRRISTPADAAPAAVPLPAGAPATGQPAAAPGEGPAEEEITDPTGSIYPLGPAAPGRAAQEPDAEPAAQEPDADRAAPRPAAPQADVEPVQGEPDAAPEPPGRIAEPVAAAGPQLAAPPPGRSWRAGNRRSRLALSAAAVVVAAAVAVIAGVAASTGSPRHGAASHTAGSGPAPKPSATQKAAASPTASPSGPAASRPATAPGGTGALPAGYHRFTNSTGFSIGVPAGWQISHDGHYVYVRDPANRGIFLLIDQSDQPQPNALADWQQQATARQSSYPGYHLIRLKAVPYPQAEQAADWEFSYDRGGIEVHILNRNILANARHAYALYWSVPESSWNADYHYFRAFAATFRPAGVNQG